MKTQRFKGSKSMAGRDSRGLPFPPDEGEGPSREDSDHGMRGQARASEGGTPRRRRSAHPLDSSDGQLVLQERPRSRAVARACASIGWLLLLVLCVPAPVPSCAESRRLTRADAARASRGDAAKPSSSPKARKRRDILITPGKVLTPAAAAPHPRSASRSPLASPPGSQSPLASPWLGSNSPKVSKSSGGAGRTPRPAESPGKTPRRMSVRWQDPAPEAPGAGAVPDRLPPGQTALFGRLATAFAERPVWSTLALRNTLGVGREELRETLPFLAYKCRDGPWKGLWSRFGFDPRVDPSARALQVCPI